MTLLLVGAVFGVDAAAADEPKNDVGANSTGTGIVTHAQQQQEAGVESGSDAQPVSSDEDTGSTAPPTTWVLQPACETVGAGGCVDTYICDDGTPAATWFELDQDGRVIDQETQCPGDPPPAGATAVPPVDIPGAVLRAFERVNLPKSAIRVQPPGGETLVNLPTILSTSAERHQIPVRLEEVDLDVTLEVWPSRFVWHHGDDTSQETTTPGKPWTEGANTADLITHTYAKTSEGLELSVDTTWSAQFKVAGQPNWRPVNGTVSITGDPVTVAVLEAKPQLVR